MREKKPAGLPFVLDPLDKAFVPPKPQNSVDDERIIKLEKENSAIYTRKRDGHYVSAVVVGKHAKIYSRGEVKDLTPNFPHIKNELLRLRLPRGGTLFSCEIIAESNGSDNREFVSRLTKASPGEALRLQKQHGFARLMVFNSLVLGGKDISGFSNSKRIATGQKLLSAKFAYIMPVEVLSGSFEGLQQLVRERKWEGMVIYDTN